MGRGEQSSTGISPPPLSRLQQHSCQRPGPGSWQQRFSLSSARPRYCPVVLKPWDRGRSQNGCPAPRGMREQGGRPVPLRAASQFAGQALRVPRGPPGIGGIRVLPAAPSRALRPEEWMGLCPRAPSGFPRAGVKAGARPLRRRCPEMTISPLPDERITRTLSGLGGPKIRRDICVSVCRRAYEGTLPGCFRSSPARESGAEL